MTWPKQNSRNTHKKEKHNLTHDDKLATDPEWQETGCLPNKAALKLRLTPNGAWAMRLSQDRGPPNLRPMTEGPGA